MSAPFDEFHQLKNIVVTGLPGSGKSTLAHQLAARLNLPVIDKDDILVALFESRGINDYAWRTTLSRIADDDFIKRAKKTGPSILVSWWRHPQSVSDSGTPVDWLKSLSNGVVELHCVCSAHIAATRFANRTRHAGHFDGRRNFVTLQSEFEVFERFGPLNCGSLIQVSTESTVDIDSIVQRYHEFTDSH